MRIIYFSKKTFFIALQLALVTMTSIYGVPNPSPKKLYSSNPQSNTTSSTPSETSLYEREEIAFRDPDEDKMLYEKNLRLGDWDYKENWRYDKQAFYNGETQYDRDNPRLRGVGYDVSDTPSPTRQYNYSRKDYAPSTERENYYRNRPQEQTNNYYNPYPYNTSQTFDSGNR